MGSEYSAINTKIRAMHAKLLNEEDYLTLCECKDVGNVISSLEQFPQYQNTFSKIPKEHLHREDVERLLLLNKYDDFSKIHRFATKEQRMCLELFFMHYEVAMLKKILRHCLSRTKSTFDFQSMKQFYLKHSHLNFEQLLVAGTIQEFADGLQGSYYEKGMRELIRKSSNIFEYETLLDQLYFRRVWSEKNALGKRTDAKVFSILVGTKIDLLNIMWIYRSKRFYHLNHSQMQSLIIPIYCRLNRSVVNALIETDTPEEFERLYSSTYYGRRSRKQRISFQPDSIFEEEMQNIYTKTRKQYPNSIATPGAYLFQKEKEIEALISLIESIRYGLRTEQIQSNIFNQGRRDVQI